MARENEHGRASERAARLQRQLQAAEATANGGDGWTTAVDAYATPKRAAAPGAPRVEAGVVAGPARANTTGAATAATADVQPQQQQGDAAQAGNVPQYQQPNE